MPITNNTTKYFQGNVPISFRSLQTTFGGNENDIKFSSYKRDNESLDPLVPDATENSSIPDKDENLSIEGFRDSINQYDIVQSGNDENISFETYFNQNLSKNVFKNLNITGTCYSTDVNEYAASLDVNTENVLNLDIDISSTGKIHGAGGNPNINSGNGGGALYVETGSGTKNFNLNISSGGQLWSGGGAGSDGTDGNTVTATCNQTRTSTGRSTSRESYTVQGNPIYVRLTTGPFNASPSRWTSYSNALSSTRRACQSINPALRTTGLTLRGALSTGNPECLNSGRAWAANEPCSKDIGWFCSGDVFTGAYNTGGTFRRETRRSYTITNNHSETVSATGGTKGTGGIGQGYSQTKTSGNSGSPGNTTPCRSGWSGPGAIGNPGNDGNPGGDWGQDSAGTAGDAVSYGKGNLTISGDSTNTFKGKKVYRK